jgi:hypothetical protein
VIPIVETIRVNQPKDWYPPPANWIRSLFSYSAWSALFGQDIDGGTLTLPLTQIYGFVPDGQVGILSSTPDDTSSASEVGYVSSGEVAA